MIMTRPHLWRGGHPEGIHPEGIYPEGEIRERYLKVSNQIN
jgi:hypothetical protein